jgi:PleD family two-component response regulator
VQTLDTTVGDVLTDFNFHRARIEHYLLRAEECIQMARYKTAQKAVEKVFSLEPENRAGKSLQKRIDYILATLTRNGSSDVGGDGSSEQTWKRQKRHALVMVVDQDERILYALTESLSKHGFDVVAAGGYDEAIEILSIMNPQLILSEVNFANGPMGFDLYLWIRTNARLQGIPFLYLATRVDRETLIAGKRLGVDDFIVKPLDEGIVIASILNCLSREKKMRS